MLLTSLYVILALATCSAVYAFWTAGGISAGSGTAATTVAMSLTPGTPTASLQPGGQASVTLAVSNPNDTTIRIGSLALDTGQATGGFGVDTAHSGCTVSALSFTTQTNGGAGWSVPAKVGATNGTLSITFANALARGTGAANACQGASITVYLAAGP
jgi:hypothetical protein